VCAVCCSCSCVWALVARCRTSSTHSTTLEWMRSPPPAPHTTGDRRRASRACASFERAWCVSGWLRSTLMAKRADAVAKRQKRKLQEMEAKRKKQAAKETVAQAANTAANAAAQQGAAMAASQPVIAEPLVLADHGEPVPAAAALRADHGKPRQSMAGLADSLFSPGVYKQAEVRVPAQPRCRRWRAASATQCALRRCNTRCRRPNTRSLSHETERYNPNLAHSSGLET
jgi:hypothetical protein